MSAVAAASGNTVDFYRLEDVDGKRSYVEAMPAKPLSWLLNGPVPAL